MLRREVHLGLKIYLGEKCATRRSFRGFLFSPNSLVFGWLVGWLCAARRRRRWQDCHCHHARERRRTMMMMLDRYFSAAFSTPPSPSADFQVEVEMVNQQARLPLRCHDEMERIFPTWEKLEREGKERRNPDSNFCNFVPYGLTLPLYHIKSECGTRSFPKWRSVSLSLCSPLDRKRN